MFDVGIRGLRNDRGMVRLVMCPAGHPFPDCGRDGISRAAAIKGRMATVRFRDLVPGTYAIAVFHDENGNGRLDRFLGIPREGFGFSGNPPLRPHAPPFAECAFAVPGATTMAIAMRYLF